MDDVADRLSNLCADLVSLRRLEPALMVLFAAERAEWVPVRELYLAADLPAEGVESGLDASWGPAPSSDPDYAVIIFFDPETQWTSTAYYNFGRLNRVMTEPQPIP